MNIQVLGSGCPTCKKLFEMTQQIVNDLGLEVKVDYLTGDEGTKRIIEMGIMSSPVLVVNNKPVMVGFLPDKDKVKRLIQSAL